MQRPAPLFFLTFPPRAFPRILQSTSLYSAPSLPWSAQRSNKMSGDKRNILDNFRRQLAAKFELKRQLYKSICNDPSLPNDVREEQRYKLSKLPRNSSFTRLRNRCIFTGRSRAVYQLFRVSRIVFRDLASKGLIMGVKKSSW